MDGSLKVEMPFAKIAINAPAALRSCWHFETERFTLVKNSDMETKLDNTNANKKKSGGKRSNAGRKSAFAEPTKTVSFRCPLSKIEELKLYVNAKLSEWSQGGI